MSWFSDIAGKAENLLNNLDEKTGAALRNHNIVKPQHAKNESEHPSVPPWKQKSPRKPLGRNATVKGPVSETKSSPSPPRSPLQPPTKNQNAVENINDRPTKLKKNARRNKSFDLNNSPKTLVEEINMAQFNQPQIDDRNTKQRRFSLPNDFQRLTQETFMYRLQNMELENTMLKNELDVMNNEVSHLLDKLKHTQEELTSTENQLMIVKKNSETTGVLSNKNEASAFEMEKLKEINQVLQENIDQLQETNKELVDRINALESDKQDNYKKHLKFENDLKYSQNVISELQLELEKTRIECQQIQSDWDAYKLRVKNMLTAKEKEIKTLYVGPNHNEETHRCVEELENLRSEREELARDVERLRNEYSNVRMCMEELESKTHSTERIVAALREALREERAVRNKLEMDNAALGKEYKKLQMDFNQSVANLKAALAEKENELMRIKTVPSSSAYQSSEPSALNVADYDAMRDTLANEKIKCLTNTLLTKQTKIDSLIADNNMMRIQMEKLESKYKNEMTALKSSQSVVQVNDSDVLIRARVKSKKYIPETVLSRVSLTIGMFMRRHPFFRVFVITYMVGLHLWVLLILLTYSPESQNSSPRINNKY